MRTTKLALVLCASLSLLSCKRHEASTQRQTEVPTVGSLVMRGTLKRKEVETSYVLVVPVGSDFEGLEKLARDKVPNLKVSRTSLAALFNPNQLAFLTKGLSPTDEAGLEASPGAILIVGTSTDAAKLARDIAGVTRDVADAANGWVIDPDSYRLYAAAEFHDHVPREHLDVRKLITVHSVLGGNEQPFLDSAGMHRYGFPELYVSEASSGQINQMTHLINGVAQALLDGNDVNERGEISVDFKKLGWDVGTIGSGTGQAVLVAKWARERGASEADDLVVELVPPSGDAIEDETKLIDECFGHEPEKIAKIAPDDPELLAAADRARGDLMKLRSRFTDGIPYDERLTVKAKFTDGEGRSEWMWVDVVRFKGDLLEGTLANDPEWIESLHDGQKVSVRLHDVGDYLHETKSGRTGGYSIELFKKRGLLPADTEY